MPWSSIEVSYWRRPLSESHTELFALVRFSLSYLSPGRRSFSELGFVGGEGGEEGMGSSTWFVLSSKQCPKYRKRSESQVAGSLAS